MPEPLQVFYCYSHRDEDLRDKLETHLTLLKRRGVITGWHDRRIAAGAEWAGQIDDNLNSAAIVLLLVSADFLASNYCYDVEMKRALERHEAGEACVIPVILRTVDWKGAPFAKLQFLPTDGKPVTTWGDVDAAFTDIAKGIRKVAERIRLRAAGGTSDTVTIPPEDISTAKLPTTSSTLFGRRAELAQMDAAWVDPNTYVVTFVAFGGVGKTALVNVWLGGLRGDAWRGAQRVYGWSFYSQGASQDRQASGDEFIAAALKWFGDSDPTQGSPWDKGERLAKLVRARRTLLILDGLEPLQYPPGEQVGRLRDPGVQSLLRELAQDNPGLCVVSTRLPVDDLKEFEDSSVQRIDLEQLSDEAGAQLLGTLGVEGTADELQKTAHEFGGHALALTLLGNYLQVVHDGDVRKHDQVPKLTAERIQGGHARRVMECYEGWFDGKPELGILRMLGLFDRPAVGGAIEALRADPPIADLTADLQGLSEPDWKYALKTLRDNGLLADPDEFAPDTLDCHPLIREHFADRLRSKHPNAWKQGHNRLYEYFKGPGCTKEFPDTLDEMAPLYAAVTHACHAGRHQEALDDVYYPRIERGETAFGTKILGAFGADLAALSGFFNPAWVCPVNGIAEGPKGYILNEAGYDLRTLGRLREAVEPLKSALDQYSTREAGWRAAVVAANLSGLFMTLGDLSQALKYARRSEELADQTGDPAERVTGRTTLATALHQTARLDEAEAAFREAEQRQKEVPRGYPILYSLRGYQYCDLLLDLGKHEEVLDRAAQTLVWVTEHNLLLDMGLDHLSLGRGRLLGALQEGRSDFSEATVKLDQAVDGLRRAGVAEFVVRGLLARAECHRVRAEHGEGDEFFKWALRDLDESLSIATRGEMRLFEADAHLEYARLDLAEAEAAERAGAGADGPAGKRADARRHFETARKMIEEMGYHRRDQDLAEIEPLL